MFFDLANSALAVLVIGLLISLAFLLPENQGRLEQNASTTLQGLRIVSGLSFRLVIYCPALQKYSAVVLARF
jgi:hypothetical protein